MVQSYSTFNFPHYDVYFQFAQRCNVLLEVLTVLPEEVCNKKEVQKS